MTQPLKYLTGSGLGQLPTTDTATFTETKLPL